MIRSSQQSQQTEADVRRTAAEHPDDELATAKQRLFDAVNPPRQQAGERNMAQEGVRLVQQHPYALAGAALVAGLLVARVPYARTALKAGLVWGAKMAVTKYVRGKMGGK